MGVLAPCLALLACVTDNSVGQARQAWRMRVELSAEQPDRFRQVLSLVNVPVRPLQATWHCLTVSLFTECALCAQLSA